MEFRHQPQSQISLVSLCHGQWNPNWEYCVTWRLGALLSLWLPSIHVVHQPMGPLSQRKHIYFRSEYLRSLPLPWNHRHDWTFCQAARISWTYEEPYIPRTSPAVDCYDQHNGGNYANQQLLIERDRRAKSRSSEIESDWRLSSVVIFLFLYIKSVLTPALRYPILRNRESKNDLITPSDSVSHVRQSPLPSIIQASSHYAGGPAWALRERERNERRRRWDTLGHLEHCRSCESLEPRPSKFTHCSLP